MIAPVMYDASADARNSTAAAIASAEDEREKPQPVQLDDPRDQYKDWGQAIYLSNDDTMSLSSAQRVIFAIDKFLPLPLAKAATSPNSSRLRAKVSVYTARKSRLVKSSGKWKQSTPSSADRPRPAEMWDSQERRARDRLHPGG